MGSMKCFSSGSTALDDYELHVRLYNRCQVRPNNPTVSRSASRGSFAVTMASRDICRGRLPLKHGHIYPFTTPVPHLIASFSAQKAPLLWLKQVLKSAFPVARYPPAARPSCVAFPEGWETSHPMVRVAVLSLGLTSRPSSSSWVTGTLAGD